VGGQEGVEAEVNIGGQKGCGRPGKVLEAGKVLRLKCVLEAEKGVGGWEGVGGGKGVEVDKYVGGQTVIEAEVSFCV